MIKILSIGNSFSNDAHRYISEVAKSCGECVKTVNLYIGGCSLATHYKNMNNDDRAYEITFNGVPTGLHTSIKEALQSDEWDFVTMQQVSRYSFDAKTYYPYIERLSEYVSYHAPNSTQVVHQTWSYEQGSDMLKNVGFTSQEEMFLQLKSAYADAAKRINAPIIPSGEMFQQLLKSGFPIHRDTYHARFGLGRFALALLWLKLLAGIDIKAVKFSDFDEPVSREEYAAAIAAADMFDAADFRK